MSKWLTGLEALLEKVDQKAATSLQGEGLPGRRPGSPSLATSRSAQSGFASVSSDDKLFEFLNDSSGTLQLDVDPGTRRTPVSRSSANGSGSTFSSTPNRTVDTTGLFLEVLLE